MSAISIIVPVFNTEKYLPRMLDSILNQSFTDFEVLCINDGSTDGSEAILSNYASRDTRIRLITQKNQGAAVARNKGLKQAQSAYIAFVDSDDVLEPQALEISYYYITRHHADMAVYKWLPIGRGALLPESKYYSVHDVKTELIENPIVDRHLSHMIWAKLYHRELLEGLQFMEGIIHDDLPFCYEVFARRPKTVFIDCPLYLYLDNPSAITASSKNLRSLKCLAIGLKRIHDVYSYENLNREFDAVKQQLVPRILNTQRKRCNRIKDADARKVMQRGFASLIHELKELKMYGWNESVCWTSDLSYTYRTLRLHFLLKKLMEEYPAE